MPEPLDEIWKLRGCISDLVSLLALPPLWRGGESPAVADVLSDVLLRMLRLDFIYVHLQESGAAASRVLRIAPREAGRAVAVPPEGVAPAPADRAAEVGHMVAPWLAAEAPVASAMVANPVGPGETAIAVVGLGGDDRCGALVAGAQREGFPSYIETLLLRVAATQAVNELQGARMRAERSHGREAQRQLLVARAESRHLRRELDSQADLGELVLGQCDGLKGTWAQAAQVASGPGCVLVLGECGAGQELVARAVHRFSRRHDQPFVQLRCSGQSAAQLEQLLFGQEDGGAAPQPGRLELAHGGTLFLDEIGDLPLELQPRLLRVLQDQTFERAGGSAALRADVRVVAAASRDLRPLVAQQRLRGDLYYRLNAATIEVPPLREWVDDMPRLVRHFAQRHARRHNKQIATIAPYTLAALRRHAWPGNLHELDNVVARGVMLSAGPQLELQLPEPVPPADHGNGSAPCLQRYVTLEDAQREHIVRALAASNWVIAGAAGAAAKLGMKRTSLQYKMHKLGITRPQVQGARAG